MADRFALFIWINDDPIRGNVLRISTIVEPRQSYEDYAVGQKVIVKCPRMGKFDAVIGKICDAKEKKHLEKILSGPEFEQLLSSLQLIPGSETSANKNESMQNEVEKGCQSPSILLGGQKGQAAQMENTSEMRPKIIKPKPVKRRVNLLQADESETVKQKRLETVAEDLAICSLNQTRTDDTCQLYRDSMALVDNDSLEVIEPTESRSPCNHEAELTTLRSSVANLEYWCQTMWNELMTLKNNCSKHHSETFGATSYQCLLSSTEKETLKNNCSKHYSETFGATSYQRLLSSTEKEEGESSQTAKSPDACVTINGNSQGATYRGYTKVQVMEELSYQRDYKKATSRAFRMLFSLQETEGHSLNGQKSNAGEIRPALEDRAKLKFLEECVQEQWPGTKTEEIRMVIRHLLKPSRNMKMN